MTPQNSTRFRPFRRMDIDSLRQECSCSVHDAWRSMRTQAPQRLQQRSCLCRFGDKMMASSRGIGYPSGRSTSPLRKKWHPAEALDIHQGDQHRLCARNGIHPDETLAFDHALQTCLGCLLSMRRHPGRSGDDTRLIRGRNAPGLM